MSGFLDDLEAQLHAAALARTAGRHPASRQGWRHLRRGGRLALALAAALVPLVVAAVVLTASGSGGAGNLGSSGGHPGPGNSQHGINQLATRYFNEAWPSTVRHDPACAPRGGALTAPRGGKSDGRPSNALLSILRVLRRPATPADRIPNWKGGPGLPGVLYIHYFRFARVEAGARYYVVVTHLPGWPATPRRCSEELRAAMQRELPRSLSHAERARILQTALRFLPGIRAKRPYDGIFLIGSGATGGAGASQLENGGAVIMSSGQTISGIVPDGVATVKLPLRPSPGHRSQTATATVVSNVFVVKAPRATLPTGEIWLSPVGKVIHRVNLNK